MTPEEKLGKLIRQRREEKGWMLQELCDKVGMNYVHISYIEKGIRVPSEEAVKKIAEVLARDKKDEEELRTQLLFLLAQIKAPKEIRNKLKLKQQEDTYFPVSMPVEFINQLRQDLKTADMLLLEKHGISQDMIRQVFVGQAALSRADVIKIAKILNKDVTDYLVKAQYIPDELRELLDNKALLMQLFRSLKQLPPESMDKTIKAIEAILNAVLASNTKGSSGRDSKTS